MNDEEKLDGGRGRVFSISSCLIWLVIFSLILPLHGGGGYGLDKRIIVTLIGLIFNFLLLVLPHRRLTRPMFKIFSDTAHKRITILVVFLMNIFLLLFSIISLSPE